MRVTIIPLVPASLTGSSDLPGGFGRAVLKRHPIWSCSVRGFACHLPYSRRGALLPHLFTLTRLRPPDFGEADPLSVASSTSPTQGPASPKRRRREGGRYIFCATSPSGCPARALPGALPCGVRTFLSLRHFAMVCGCRKQRSSGLLRHEHYRVRTVRRNGERRTPHRT